MRYQVWLYDKDERVQLLAECESDHVFGMAATLWGALAPWWGFGSQRTWHIQVEQEDRAPGERVWARI